MAQRYLVLDSTLDIDSFRWNLDSLLQGWLKDFDFQHRYREGDPVGLQRDVWEAKDTAAILSLVEDHKTPAKYIIVESGSHETTDKIADKLDEVPMVATVSLKELQHLAENSNNPSELVRMALATTPEDVDKRSVEIILAALKHKQPLVRYRAAQAAGLALSVEFPPMLKDLAKNDSDEAVRSMAEHAILNYKPEYR